VFTARYAKSSYITQIRLVFKMLRCDVYDDFIYYVGLFNVLRICTNSKYCEKIL